MNGDFVRTKGLIAIAVGAGVIIGAASSFLYQQLFGERRRLLQEDIYQLTLSVADIRKEVQNLKALESRLKLRTRHNSTIASIVTDAGTEVFSAVGTDDLDEYFDFSSDENMLEPEVGKEAVVEDLESIDVLLTQTTQDKTKAYGLLLDRLEQDETNLDVLWRLGKVCHLLGSAYGCDGNDTKKQEFIQKGVEFSERAIQKDSNSANAHKWYAVCVGARGQFQSIKDKIQDGFLFKSHVETAIGINPSDPTLYHLLGRFKYEVASLSWIEKRVAKSLFGEIPTAKFPEAVEDLLKTEELNDFPWKENKLLIAKCYIGESDYKNAIQWLDKAAEITSSSPEDEAADKEITTLQTKYATYRVST